MAKRRNFTDQYEARVASVAPLGDKAVQEIATTHQSHPNQVRAWKRQATDGMVC
ncbi:transposase [Sulfitobacter sp. JBTF-M27]|uniref:Transposase n=1 Tax=Sulfitobacter sediminilitoris TaxID=2698830 RepID=A0A6P0CGZ2_9RHOB|nr:transposase [Sulfitobacter sediminilitoris]